MQPDFLHVPDDCQIVSSRIFNAPPETVFETWANPDILRKWWGPAGFTNTFHEFDFKPGGTWRFTMHGPEKGNYENECVFEVIDRPRLIVWNRISQPLFRVVTSFEETPDGKTHLIFRQQFATREACEKIRKYTVGKNDENFDKLEKEL